MYETYENILIYIISCKTLTVPEPLCITLDKIDGFVRVRGDKFRQLVLFDHGLFDKIHDKIK